MASKSTVITVVLLVASICMIISGISLIFVFKTITRNTIFEQMPLKNGSASYKNWVLPNSPVYMQFWFFNVKNPDEVIKYGDKPILGEAGPFTYSEVRPKEDITHHPNDTLSFKQPKGYVFEPKMSVATEDHMISFVNLPLLTVAQMVEQYNSSLLDHALSDAIAITKSGLFARHSVRELLWGYRDPVLEMIHLVNKSVDPVFGLFYGPSGNGTDDGLYTIHTGEDDIFKLNLIDKWNGSPNLTYWRTKYCNMINGTDGTLYHPFIDKMETLQIFSSDVCRSIPVAYTKDVKVKGIPTYRFSPPPSTFADVKDNPDNLGYCTPNCLKAGVLNVSVCREGAPVIMSQPHFYQGDTEYINAMEGLHPDGSQHATYIDVEPNTGTVLQAAKRLQFNAYVAEHPALADTNKIHNVIFPILWLNESAVLGSSDATNFRQTVLKPMLIAQGVQYGLLTAGVVLGLIIIAWIIKERKAQKTNYKLMADDNASPINITRADQA